MTNLGYQSEWQFMQVKRHMCIGICITELTQGHQSMVPVGVVASTLSPSTSTSRFSEMTLVRTVPSASWKPPMLAEHVDDMLHFGFGVSTNTHTHTQPFYGSMDFVWDNPGEPVPEETFTHSHLICFIHLLWSMASSLFNPPAWQSFFHNLSPSFLWSTSYIYPSTSYFIHFFTQSLFSFRNTCPYHRNLFRCSTEIMTSNASLSLNPLFGIL